MLKPIQKYVSGFGVFAFSSLRSLPSDYRGPVKGLYRRHTGFMYWKINMKLLYHLGVGYGGYRGDNEESNARDIAKIVGKC